MLIRFMNRLQLMTLLLGMTVLGLSSCHSPFSEEEDIADVWPTDKSCHLHSGQCTLKHGNQQVTLSISPNNPIPVARLLDAKVSLTNIPAKNVQIDITGLNMYMGYNRTTLSPLTSNSTAQLKQYKGNIILAFCTNDTMQWQLSVLITTPKGKIISAPFLLTTDIN